LSLFSVAWSPDTRWGTAIYGLDSTGRTGHHRRCGHWTATGSFRATVPMPPAPDARRWSGSEPSHAGAPIRRSTLAQNRTIRSTLRTGGYLSSCSTLRKTVIRKKRRPLPQGNKKARRPGSRCRDARQEEGNNPFAALTGKEMTNKMPSGPFINPWPRNEPDDVVRLNPLPQKSKPRFGICSTFDCIVLNK